MIEETRTQRIKKAITQKPYNYIFITALISFFTFNWYLNELGIFFTSLYTLEVWFSTTFILLMIIITLLVPLTISLAYMRIKSIGMFKVKEVGTKEGASSIGGILTGILAGSCPACFAGLFPAFMGLFGITASLSSLPLNGIELQIGSIILLLLAVWMLSKEPLCKVKFTQKK
jgi:hypothetical protein